MATSFGNSFVLGVLSVLASGYIVYESPIRCWFWPGRHTGYVLYFRIITAGLLMLFVSYALFIIALPSLRDLSLEPEDVLLVTFPLALVLYALAVAVVYCSSYVDSQWAEELKDRELSGKGLERFVWGKISRREMILITLDSKKVYAGWPLEIPDDETKQWLRFAPEWSGYRDDKSATIHIETDYSEVFNQSQLEKNHMLVQVEKIVTLQPFDIDAFQQFNLEELPESN